LNGCVWQKTIRKFELKERRKARVLERIRVTEIDLGWFKVEGARKKIEYYSLGGFLSAV
jgi:hypothetical protein